MAGAAAPAEGRQGAARPADLEGPKLRRLLDDEEVALLRQVEARIQLRETKSGTTTSLPDLLQPGSPLYEADVICVGELHDSEADHAMQRLLLDSLTYRLFVELRTGEGVDAAAAKGRTPQNDSPQKVALGVEYFTRQQQPTLDDLIFGSRPSDSATFRAACDWDNVWSYDWSIYAPLFRFCQLNLTRVVGLNVPYEASLMVSRGGVDALPQWLRDQLPPLDLTQRKHRRRFEDMLRLPLEEAVARMALPEGEGDSPRPGLDHMYEAQVLWDEYMADTARRYLDANGGRLMVFAGTNHVWRDAIPDRLERQSRNAGKPHRAVSVVPWHGRQSGDALPRWADYLLLMEGPGGGEALAREVAAQRQRLRGKARVFPAGFL